MRAFIFIYVLLVISSGFCYPEIYKHVDENGRVIYKNHSGSQNKSGAGNLEQFDEKHYREYLSFIEKFSHQYNIDKNLIISIIFIESYFNKDAVSKKGACGLMQLMPETAKRFSVKDIFDPKENIKGGTAYLKYLFDFFDGDLRLILSAYNAGENIVKKYGDIPPFKETRNYVKKVSEVYKLLNKNTIYIYYDSEGNRRFTNDISIIPKGLSYKRFEINN